MLPGYYTRVQGVSHNMYDNVMKYIMNFNNNFSPGNILCLKPLSGVRYSSVRQYWLRISGKPDISILYDSSDQCPTSSSGKWAQFYRSMVPLAPGSFHNTASWHYRLPPELNHDQFSNPSYWNSPFERLLPNLKDIPHEILIVDNMVAHRVQNCVEEANLQLDVRKRSKYSNPVKSTQPSSLTEPSSCSSSISLSIESCGKSNIREVSRDNDYQPKPIDLLSAIGALFVFMYACYAGCCLASCFLIA
uniref:Uncharacterized protein n=1 Tax=Glossina pallidipes TaxID=7398 RepID=A0A1A9ZSG6_GLOPL